MPKLTLLVTGLEERGVLRPEEASFLPENKPFWARKGLHKGQETRHREYPCTRSPRICQPYRSDTKPPSRKGAAF